MKMGTYIHEILEYTNFKNKDLSNIKDEFIKKKITSLINNKIFDNVRDAKIYKEYEFRYTKDNNEYKNYIMMKSKKRVNLYLYSIMDEVIKEL